MLGEVADEQEGAGEILELGVKTRWQPPVKGAKSFFPTEPRRVCRYLGDTGIDQAREAKIVS